MMAQGPMTDGALAHGVAEMARIMERRNPGLRFTFGPRQEMAEPAAEAEPDTDGPVEVS